MIWPLPSRFAGRGSEAENVLLAELKLCRILEPRRLLVVGI